MRTRLRLLKALLRRQDGISLIMAAGVLGVLSISGATLISYSSANERSANFSHDNNAAYSIAEAGLNQMLAILNHRTNDPTQANLLPLTTTTLAGGTAKWSGTFDSATWKWSLTSTGTVANPTGPGSAAIRRTLTAKVPVYPVNTQPLAVDSWNYVYSWGTGDPDGCDMLINAGVQVSTRLMAAGNLCWANGTSMITGELLVGGTNTTNGSAVIGSAAQPVPEVHVANGCRFSTGAIHNPCQGAPTHEDKVWATNISSNPGILAPPVTDFARWYEKASPGPKNPCQSSLGTPPVFENETNPKLRNRSVPGTFNLTPNSSYKCITLAGENLMGELSWDNVLKVLTVRGTIFIDGNAYISQSGSYSGQATLYLSGSFLINQVKFCAVTMPQTSDCNFGTGAWDPNTRLLTVVTNGAGGQAGVGVDESMVLNGAGAMWQGALYGGAYKVRLAAGFQSSGPMIADEVILSSSTVQQGFSVITDVPTGMPGNPSLLAQPDKPQLYSG